MTTLHTSIPLTVFNQTFARLDNEEHNQNHSTSSSSKVKSNKGLEAPSEYTLSFGEWSKCMSLFRRYLAGYYGQAPLAKRLKLHIENVKNIKRSTECWMTALHYDILCRSQTFVKRGDNGLMKDIGIHVQKYENQAKEKSLRFGEANGGDANPHAKGGRLEFKHPETGLNNSTNLSSNKREASNIDPHQFKKRRGQRNKHGLNYTIPSYISNPTQHQPPNHALPPNPLSYTERQPLPIAAPMAANKFPS
ncbi:uncharacterized protein MELLADRAFT_101163 [Melampsora larici-populina 98AG31]|uniref:Uncharacterized protein n=1 Tax=Melampsora larici-populina (strain 98AG31 / pathotype 3-4-7) TaxID=747676 RepID=F4R3T8_MELLP|nr:uncharacterized protein MELLADRAFT_101163 [Melampsora larici-populina 98AG31]EGG13110.1 hypothetical protein MELLADRAFT_101163 [Melampsora larici-populina 98AG31]